MESEEHIMENLKVVIEGSGRHIHLTEEAAIALFGTADLPQKRGLTIPGAFVYDAKATLVGPKGQIEGVSVLGPHRKAVQVELSYTDARILGVEPPVRNSGDTKDSCPITIVGPKATVSFDGKEEGAIVANRHIHMSTETAEKYGFKDKEEVMVKVEGQRGLIFENVLIRLAPGIPDNMHIDYDEQNAAGLRSKPMIGEVIKYEK